MADDKKPTLGGIVSAGMVDRRQKLKIWAIRSVIVLVLAALIAWRGPQWVLWLAIIYVVGTLVTAFALTRPGNK